MSALHRLTGNVVGFAGLSRELLMFTKDVVRTRMLYGVQVSRMLFMYFLNSERVNIRHIDHERTLSFLGV